MVTVTGLLWLDKGKATFYLPLSKTLKYAALVQDKNQKIRVLMDF
jgi:predicted P-loop ATPase/GTPase